MKYTIDQLEEMLRGNNNKPIEVWACAFKTDYSEKSMANSFKPYKGFVMDIGYGLPRFIPMKKNGEPRSKSSAVYLYARHLFDNKEECVEYYNQLIDVQIGFLNKLIDECEKYRI